MDAAAAMRLVERLAELRGYLDHAATLRLRVADSAALERDLSLHNDLRVSRDERLPRDVVESLERLPGFRTSTTRFR